MGTRRPVGEWVDLGADLARRIVAGQAQLAARAVLNQKILRDKILGLNVRVVAGDALHISLNELDAAGRIGGLPAGGQRSDKIDVVFERQGQAEWVRKLHVGAERVSRIHGAAHRDLAVGNRGAHGHRTVMAA